MFCDGARLCKQVMDVVSLRTQLDVPFPFVRPESPLAPSREGASAPKKPPMETLYTSPALKRSSCSSFVSSKRPTTDSQKLSCESSKLIVGVRASIGCHKTR